MGRRVTRGRRDGNHAAIVQAFRDTGCSVIELTDTGVPGWPDLAIGLLGRTELVEVKNPGTAYGRAGLSATQTAFASEWRGSRIWIATSTDEALALVSNWRKR